MGGFDVDYLEEEQDDKGIVTEAEYDGEKIIFEYEYDGQTGVATVTREAGSLGYTLTDKAMEQMAEKIVGQPIDIDGNNAIIGRE